MPANYAFKLTAAIGHDVPSARGRLTRYLNAMRILPPPESSPLTAFFCAPLITPILAVPLAAFLPGTYSNDFDFLLLAPFVAVASLIYGYVGMIFVCLPVILALRTLRKLNAITLCFFTTAIGATIFALFWGDMPGHETNQHLMRFAVGGGCSLGVSAFYCLLGDISFRSNGT